MTKRVQKSSCRNQYLSCSYHGCWHYATYPTLFTTMCTSLCSLYICPALTRRIFELPNLAETKGANSRRALRIFMVIVIGGNQCSLTSSAIPSSQLNSTSFHHPVLQVVEETKSNWKYSFFQGVLWYAMNRVGIRQYFYL